MLRILAATTALSVLACGARSRPEHPRPFPPSSTPPADAAPTAPPTDAAPTAASTYTIPVAPVTVTRLGRGQGSAEVLRYTYAVGSTQDVEQTFDASVEITIVSLGQHASQPVPTQHFGGRVVALSAGGGAATLVITIDRASALDAQMNEQLEKLIGARIEHEVLRREENRDGRAHDASVVLGGDVDFGKHPPARSPAQRSPPYIPPACSPPIPRVSSARRRRSCYHDIEEARGSLVELDIGGSLSRVWEALARRPRAVSGRWHRPRGSDHRHARWASCRRDAKLGR